MSAALISHPQFTFLKTLSYSASLDTLVLILPLILILKVFFWNQLTFQTKKLKKNSFSKFLLFTLASLKKNKLIFVLSTTWLKNKIVFFMSTFKHQIHNYTHTLKFPKYLLWRPLFKKSSYYGLFVNTRSKFLKIFK